MPAPIRKVLSKRTQNPKVFGHIPGIPVGTCWDSRQACSDDAVHSGILAGIHGSSTTGAYSVALSGGYEDDEDNGYTFTYTGCGGRDTGEDNKRRTGPQAFDQSFEKSYRNMALKVSSMTGKPVRVVRSFNLDSEFAPAEGYRYDGLYTVERAWRETGKAGFLVCKYFFRRLPDQSPIPTRERNGGRGHPIQRPPKRKAASPLPEPKFEGTRVRAPAEDDQEAGTSRSAGRAEHPPPLPRTNTIPSTSTSASAGATGAYDPPQRRALDFVPYHPNQAQRHAGPSGTSHFKPKALWKPPNVNKRAARPIPLVKQAVKRDDPSVVKRLRMEGVGSVPSDRVTGPDADAGPAPAPVRLPPASLHDEHDEVRVERRPRTIHHASSSSSSSSSPSPSRFQFLSSSPTPSTAAPAFSEIDIDVKPVILSSSPHLAAEARAPTSDDYSDGAGAGTGSRIPSPRPKPNPDTEPVAEPMSWKSLVDELPDLDWMD